ncbi:hypothetical protein DL89DRAFT_221259, partial [Linderina pennispora]
RQLVSLCCTFLWKRRILSLDGATANVDTMADHTMQQVIRDKFRNSTFPTIMHRLRAIMDSGWILVMDQGRVAGFVAPASLLEQDYAQALGREHGTQQEVLSFLHGYGVKAR